MGLFDRTDYIAVGKTAKVESFSEAFARVNDGKRNKLIEGAIEAFRDGHSENLQAAIVNPNTYAASILHMLQQITKGSDDKAAVIDQAFANADKETKSELLDKILLEAIKVVPAEESFVVALLKCGADANAEQAGFFGAFLALSVAYDQSPTVSQLLVDNGANVEGALAYAYAYSYAVAYKSAIKSYRARTVEAAHAADTQATIQALRDDVQTLTGKVDSLSAELREALDYIRAHDKAGPLLKRDTTLPKTVHRPGN